VSALYNNNKKTHRSNVMVRKILSSLAAQLVIVLLGLAIVSACSLDSNVKVAPTMTLVNTDWQLKTLEGATINSKRPLSMRFDESRINGYAGCNSFFGNYTASSDGVFSTGSIGTTKMACLGEGDLLEQQYLAKLAQAKQYVISRDQLHLLDAQRKTLLVFNATKPEQTKAK
jgi:heat shock protein HslJ